MSADASLSTPFVLNRPDGTSRTFKKCTPEDRITFRGTFRYYRKLWRAETLQVLGITGDKAIEELNKLDRARLMESEVIQWVLEPEGQNAAILLSLQKDNPKATMADVYALDLDDYERQQVAIAVFNLVVETKGEKKQDGGPDRPLPDGTEIGAATPASSPGSAESLTPSDSPSTSSTPA
jgi:hypothetical protein